MSTYSIPLMYYRVDREEEKGSVDYSCYNTDNIRPKYVFSRNDPIFSNPYTTISQRAVWISKANVLPDYIAHEKTSISKITLNFKLTVNEIDLPSFGIAIRIMEADIPTNNASKAWDYVNRGIECSEFYVYSTTVNKSIVIEDLSWIEYILNYGISITVLPGDTAGKYYPKIESFNAIIEFESETMPPEINITAPTASDNNVITEDLTVKWSYSQSANVAPTRFELFYQEGEDWVPYTAAANAERSCQISPTMLRRTGNEISGIIRIKVRGYISSSIYGESPPYEFAVYYISCADLKPANGELQILSDKIRLSWRAVPTQGAPPHLTVNTLPSNYRITYSENSGETWLSLVENAEVITEDNRQYYDVPKDTFANGVIQWRVTPLIYGHEQEISPKATFIARAQASVIYLNCDGKPTPTLNWSATSQVAYQVQFGDYDSGAVYSSANTCMIPYIFDDGIYKTRIRTQASSGVWSEWSEMHYVTIKNNPANISVNISVQATRHAVVISLDPITTYCTAIVLYRNNIPIKNGKFETFTDVAATGHTEYKVKAKGVNYYAQSNTVTVDATPKNDCLYDMDAQEWIPLKYSLNERERSYDNSVETFYKYYSGRTKPVAFTENNSTRTVTLSYVLKTREEAERIMKLAGKVIVYKDTNGGIMFGVLTAPNYISGRFYPVSFSITEIDYDEKVKI